MKPVTDIIVSILANAFPWHIKRYIYTAFMGYEIDKSAYIGLSLICANKLILNKGARIGHFNVIRNLELIQMGAFSVLGNNNNIYGYRAPKERGLFDHETDRKSCLILEDYAAITNQHVIDCSNVVMLEEFATLAGCRSQILTHSVDLQMNRQSSSPVKICAYSFVGTGVVLLKGSILPSYSVLGAGSVLTKPQNSSYALYAGSPAKFVKNYDHDLAYFTRKSHA